jgi:hypothetical protein
MFNNKDDDHSDDDYNELKEGGADGVDNTDKFIIKYIRGLPGLGYLFYTVQTFRYKGYRPFAILLLTNALSENIDNIILIYE